MIKNKKTSRYVISVFLSALFFAIGVVSVNAQEAVTYTTVLEQNASYVQSEHHSGTQCGFKGVNTNDSIWEVQFKFYEINKGGTKTVLYDENIKKNNETPLYVTPQHGNTYTFYCDMDVPLFLQDCLAYTYMYVC